METEKTKNRQKDLDFCRELVDKVPALVPVLENHLESEDGELHTNIFLGAVARWAEENFVARESDVVQLLLELNRGLAEGEREVPNLIAVGFGESLSFESPLVPLLKGDLKRWYEFDAGISEEEPRLRRGGK